MRGVVVTVGVWVRLRVRDGEREFAGASPWPCCQRRVGVVESVRSSRGERRVRGQRRRSGEAQAGAVARVLGVLGVLHSPMLLGMRGNAADRALPLRGGEPVREYGVLRNALRVVAMVMVVGWWLRCRLLPSYTDSSSSTAVVAVLGM